MSFEKNYEREKIMSLQDPLADMFTRIRNAQSATKKQVMMPSSKEKLAIAKVLKEEGYIENYSVNAQDSKLVLQTDLKYHETKPVIELIERVSRPGLRMYRRKDDLPKVNGGLGISIISTSKGVMSDRVARTEGLGGEIVCRVF